MNARERAKVQMVSKALEAYILTTRPPSGMSINEVVDKAAELFDKHFPEPGAVPPPPPDRRRWDYKK